MPDLNNLYQRVILDHNRNPRNFYRPERSNRMAKGYNPVCGDQVTIFVQSENDVLCDIGFQGSGCAISKASASLMTEAVKGKSRAEAQETFETLCKMLTEPASTGIELFEPPALNSLSGVRKFPVRIKCALLPWQTLMAALEGRDVELVE